MNTNITNNNANIEECIRYQPLLTEELKSCWEIREVIANFDEGKRFHKFIWRFIRWLSTNRDQISSTVVKDWFNFINNKFEEIYNKGKLSQEDNLKNFIRDNYAFYKAYLYLISNYWKELSEDLPNSMVFFKKINNFFFEFFLFDSSKDIILLHQNFLNQSMVIPQLRLTALNATSSQELIRLISNFTINNNQLTILDYLKIFTFHTQLHLKNTLSENFKNTWEELSNQALNLTHFLVNHIFPLSVMLPFDPYKEYFIIPLARQFYSINVGEYNESLASTDFFACSPNILVLKRPYLNKTNYRQSCDLILATTKKFQNEFDFINLNISAEPYIHTVLDTSDFQKIAQFSNMDSTRLGGFYSFFFRFTVNSEGEFFSNLTQFSASRLGLPVQQHEFVHHLVHLITAQTSNKNASIFSLSSSKYLNEGLAEWFSSRFGCSFIHKMEALPSFNLTLFMSSQFGGQYDPDYIQALYYVDYLMKKHRGFFRDLLTLPVTEVNKTWSPVLTSEDFNSWLESEIRLCDNANRVTYSQSTTTEIPINSTIQENSFSTTAAAADSTPPVVKKELQENSFSTTVAADSTPPIVKKELTVKTISFPLLISITGGIIAATSDSLSNKCRLQRPLMASLIDYGFYPLVLAAMSSTSNSIFLHNIHNVENITNNFLANFSGNLMSQWIHKPLQQEVLNKITNKWLRIGFSMVTFIVFTNPMLLASESVISETFYSLFLFITQVILHQTSYCLTQKGLAKLSFFQTAENNARNSDLTQVGKKYSCVTTFFNVDPSQINNDSIQNHEDIEESTSPMILPV